MLDVEESNLPTVLRASCGTLGGANPICIKLVATGAIVIQNCQSETGAGVGEFIDISGAPSFNPITLLGNTINDPIVVRRTAKVISIGNIGPLAYGTATTTSSGARIISIGDVFNLHATCTASGWDTSGGGHVAKFGCGDSGADSVITLLPAIAAGPLQVDGVSTNISSVGGTGGGDYSSASGPPANVPDITKTLTIPVGMSLHVQAHGQIGVLTASAKVFAGLADGGSVIPHTFIDPTPSAVGVWVPFSISGTIVGDGASHVITLQFATSNVLDSVTIENDSSSLSPAMTFVMEPSN